MTLLYRTTRQLSLTTEGQVFYDKVRDMLTAAETGLDLLNDMLDSPSGELRVTAPEFVIQSGVMDLLAHFASDNQSVTLRINFSDESKDLIKGGFDMAIRVGVLQDSGLMTRSIGSLNRILVASNDYVVSQGGLGAPQQLQQCDWLHLSQLRKEAELTGVHKKSITVKYRNRIEVNSVQALSQLARRGLGVALLPESVAKEGINAQQLVRVLPEWELSPMPVHAVWPDTSRRAGLTLKLVRYLVERWHEHYVGLEPPPSTISA